MDNAVLELHIECICCGTEFTITVPADRYMQWRNREAKIQDALPMLSADERELLMSGMCGACFDSAFGD